MHLGTLTQQFSAEQLQTFSQQLYLSEQQIDRQLMLANSEYSRIQHDLNARLSQAAQLLSSQ